MGPTWRFGIWLLLASVAGLAGLLKLAPFLSEELGPEPLRTTSVMGTVHLRGRSIGNGWVELIPTEGTIGNLRSAPLKPDGTFRASRVAVGRIAVRLVNPPADAGVWGTFRSFASPIRRTISGPSPVVLDIDLQDEELRYLRGQRRGKAKRRLVQSGGR